MADRSVYDDIVVGAGHNGLTAAAYLARAGRRVLVLERLDHVGGAAVSAAPFPGVDARLSRYSYLVSLLPRPVVEDLELDVRLVRRRYSSYTPVAGRPHPRTARRRRGPRGDPGVIRARARQRRGLRCLATVLRPDGPGRRAALAHRPRAPALRRRRASPRRRRRAVAGPHRPRRSARSCGRRSPTTPCAGIVATDALIGTFADLDDPALAQNVCFLYHLIGGGTGDWDVPVGGMGAVTDALARAAAGAGAELVTGADVVSVDGDGEVVWRPGRARAPGPRSRPRRPGAGPAGRPARGVRLGAGGR